MMGKGTVAGISVAMLMMAGCALNGGLGQEWATISEAQSKVHFDAPGLAGGTARFYHARSGKQHDIYTGQWVGPGRQHAEALIVLQQLSPDYYFGTEIDLREKLRGVKEGSDLNFDKGSGSEKKFGTIRYETFTADSAPCVGFYQYSGIVHTDYGLVPLGDTLFFGYYCAAVGGSLSLETVSTVLAGLRVEK